VVIASEQSDRGNPFLDDPQSMDNPVIARERSDRDNPFFGSR